MTNSKILSSLFWKFFERCGAQVVQLIVQIILARLLLPEDYGVVAIVTIFISIASVFIQSGFNTALIQKKQVNNTDYSSVLYLSLVVALIIYIILYFTAPIIADFYDQDILVSVLRVLSLNLFTGAILSIYHAIIARKMEFKKNFFCSLISIVISGILGIILAYKNFGVWALVFQQLISNTLLVLVFMFVIRWKPKLTFSFKRVKSLFSYGWKLLCSSLIENIYGNLYDLVIGKKYSTSALAYYNKGKTFPYLVINNINTSISTVLLPAMSANQDDKQIVKNMTRRSITIGSYLIFPLMFGLAAVAKPLVSILLTDKWLECVPFLQILCFSYAFYPIHTANLQAINSIGRSDIFLKLEIIKKVVGITILIITIPLGLYAMALGQILMSLISTFINAFPNRKLLDYRYTEQLKDIFPSLLISTIMGLSVYLLLLLGLNNILTITLQFLLGVILYVFLSYIFKNSSFNYILNEFKKILKRKNIS